MRNLVDPNQHGIYPESVTKSITPDYSIKGTIGLIDADLLDNGTKFPNLAIMKLSSYFKQSGCTVRLIENYDELRDGENYRIHYDALFISKVFDFTKIDSNLLKQDNVFFSGTGFFFNYSPGLPHDIEHCMPDYHIYDEYILHDTKYKNKARWENYQNYSIGFATRGCFRQCKFCVNQNETQVRFHSHVSEWLDPSRKAIYLLDDNILGYSHWKEVLEELQNTGKQFKFIQGMDMRLMTPDKAEFLNQCNYLDDFIFAFDNLNEAEIIEQKLSIWRQYNHRRTKFYILCGFESQDEKEVEGVFQRIEILMRYGCIPYIMRHENYNNSPYKGMFTQLARWCNQPQFFKKMSFREYVYSCQGLIKIKGYISSPLKTLLEFQDRFPDIADRYFDLKFSEQKYVICYPKS